jgi:3-hydroxyisobutyrate dehydrogenase-like beta-hydroxyacid dehydrogenase
VSNGSDTQVSAVRHYIVLAWCPNLLPVNILHKCFHSLRNGIRRAFYQYEVEVEIAAHAKAGAMKPITQENTRLGFIGIGYMGLPVARRLLEAGFKLTAYDSDPNKSAELIQYGGKVAQSISQLSAGCDVVLSCLPSDQVVLDVYRSSGGVFANATPGLRAIELSTVSPEISQQVSRLGSGHGIDVLDVTMSGSTPVAEKGLLTLFGGGDKEFFDDAESIFRVIAQKYFYLGPSGSGATMKLVVNAILGIGMQAIAEAVALGEKAGLDRARLLTVLSQTAVVAPAHVGKLLRSMKNDYTPQFLIRLMNKDLGLILDLAAAVGAQVPATEAAFKINTRQADLGAEQDYSAVILEMERQANLEVEARGHNRTGVASAKA